MRTMNHQQPIIVCKPRIIWKVFNFSMQILFLFVFFYFLRFLNSSESDFIGIILVCPTLAYLFSIFVFVYTYPPTVYIYDNGLCIKRRTSDIFVEWNDIVFVKYKSSLFVKSLGIASKQFPNHKRVESFIQYFRFIPTYTLQNTIHSDFDVTADILRTKLGNRFSSGLF